MNKIIKTIKENKLLFILCIIVFVILIYCSLNTFVMNDDLPYSFYYRTDVRVTNLLQAFKNQVADYFNINGRVIIHFIVQSLLIFDKKLWSILNPLVIIIGLLLVVLISNEFNNYKNKSIKFIVVVSLFLCFFEFKYLIYWVAGSVNYVWLSTILLGFIYYYIKKGIDNDFIVNSIIILFISILHESSLVFMIIFIIFDLVIKKIKKEKIYKKYLLYILAICISSVFIFACPGNQNRIDSSAWNHLNLLSKLSISIPVVSYNLFNLRSINHIVPAIYIISIQFCLFKLKEKKAKILILLNISISLLGIIFNNGYMYFIFAALLLISDIYINYVKKRYNLINITLGFYAIAFSMILVSEYAASRPNYFFYIYAILSIIINVFQRDLNKNKFKNLLITIFIISFCILLGNEIYIYKNIGDVYKAREETINKCKAENCEKLFLKKVPKNLSKYHVDSNAMNSNYFAYRYFINYYGLNDVEMYYID